MRLSDFFVCTAAFGPGWPLRRDSLIASLLDGLAAAGHIPRDAVRPILDSVLRREGLGSTGVGGGLALPNARHPAVPRPMGVLAVCYRPVEFDSVDGGPVDVVALCLAPPDGPAEHLGEQAWRSGQLLRALGKQDFCQELRKAGSAEEVAAAVWAEDGGMTARNWAESTSPVAMLGRLLGRPLGAAVQFVVMALEADQDVHRLAALDRPYEVPREEALVLRLGVPGRSLDHGEDLLASGRVVDLDLPKHGVAV